jgi:hypothetical protein
MSRLGPLACFEPHCAAGRFEHPRPPSTPRGHSSNFPHFLHASLAGSEHFPTGPFGPLPLHVVFLHRRHVRSSRCRASADTMFCLQVLITDVKYPDSAISNYFRASARQASHDSWTRKTYTLDELAELDATWACGRVPAP